MDYNQHLKNGVLGEVQRSNMYNNVCTFTTQILVIVGQD